MLWKSIAFLLDFVLFYSWKDNIDKILTTSQYH